MYVHHEKQPATYIITNKKYGTLYTGVTSNIIQRIYQHKAGIFKGFSKKYGCKQLVYYEFFSEMNYAIEYEKRIKSGSRNKKIEIIEKLNPKWKDLYDDLLGVRYED